MRVGFTLSFLWPLFSVVSSTVVPAGYELEQEWSDGFLAKIRIPIAQRYNHGWLLSVKYEASVVGLDIFEAELVSAHPNSKEYVFKNKDYNTVVHYYKDKVLDLFLQGNQYPNGDKSVYRPPPMAEAIFVAYKSPTETMMQALRRIEELPPDQRIPIGIKSSTTTTAFTSTTEMTTLLRTTSTTTTRLPMIDWFNPVTNILQTTARPTPLPATTKKEPSKIAQNYRHNLREVIKKSLLFYEAQRSGYLPISNRISWRSHSALRDGSDRGIDLTGGYYTDGSHIKYGFPLASALTILSWGAIEFKRGYVSSKELGNLLAAIKWGTDYLIKCHVNPNEFYGQISDLDTENEAWIRPEDMRGVRPSYSISRSKPGSDLAAESAAALAAASIALKSTNPTYSERLVNHSISLFRFADRYRGKYDQAISEAHSEYKSSGYFDELAWAATWLYGVTTEKEYLEIAVRRLAQSQTAQPPRLLNWDDKRIAAVALLAQMTNRTEFRIQLLDFCDSMLVGGNYNYTHKGLLYISGQDTTSLASNSGFICLFASDLGLRTDVYRRFAQQQLNYIIGDSGQSFVVGYGKTSPKRPYHMASSCPPSPQRCSWNDRDSNIDNPHELTGALVSGPDIWDNYNDIRDSSSNRVSIYNNAGFQTLTAGILQIQVASDTFSDPEPGELMPAIRPTFQKHQDYAQVLRYSNMFYEAQRSGKLPFNTRIPWRKSACVHDRSPDGIDLSGGFFDGADYIKFNFPMAFSTTVLAWGMLKFPLAYELAGEANALRSLLQWSTLYFIKCHSSKYEFYGQVGVSAFEHSHWMRPEDIDYMRPAQKITKNHPGTELAAEAAAAMAATAAVFQDVDENYANLLIKHSKELYEFADQYRGLYHRSIRDAAQFYPSYNGYKDELVWASIWLYIATNETMYLKEAVSKYQQFRMNKYSTQEFYWDDKLPGINLLMADLTKKKVHRTQAKKFCDNMINNGKYTPKGLLYRKPWGPFQYSSGAALICLMTAEIGIRKYDYRKFAKKQIDYILGDGGRGSFIVGYGPVPPKQPYHRASSCPKIPLPCNFTALYSKENNPYTLYGAVVGGPDHKDQYVDDRTNVRSNKVTLAYNAAFQSAVAALRNLEILPSPTPQPKTKKPKRTVKPKNRRKKQNKTKPTVKATTIMQNRTVDFTTASGYSSNIPFSSEEKNPFPGSNRNNRTELSVNSTTNTVQMDELGNATKVYWNNVSNVSIALISATTMTHASYRGTNAHSSNSTGISTVHRIAPTVPTDPTQTSRFPLEGGSLPTNTTTVKITNKTMNLTKHDANITIQDRHSWQKTRHCGRQRALELFNACVIPTDKFQHHPDSLLYRCRYRAFKGCVGVQTDNCIDGVWTYFPYWNHHASDEIYFTVDDISCKDKKTIDIENCEMSGMTAVFQECYQTVKTWNSSMRKEGECRWKVFGTCVSLNLDHCKQTWRIWEIWNIGLPTEEQFSKEDMICPTSNALGPKSASFFLIASLSIFISNLLYN